MLVLAHPGHELFVYEWMRRARPAVHILTDGRSRAGQSRIDECRAVVESCGASCGALFGRFSDGQVYSWLLAGEHGPLLEWCDDLTSEIIAARPEVLVGDACERQYLTHDICRLLIDAAVERAANALDSPIACYSFPMYGYCGDASALRPRREITIELDEATLTAKQRAAVSYTDTGLRTETDWFLEARGRDWFGLERLMESAAWNRAAAGETGPPAYEELGRRLVEQGVYERAVTFRGHVVPFAEALAAATQRGGDLRCAS
ncbi:MAG TPA: hypothetical protein VEC57_07445 [Candidatus Limnocylindrales bacterium]|nr:hypothetical protein [Candidatus Limnocylindrales bacterium]